METLDELKESQKKHVEYINKTIKEGGIIEKIWWNRNRSMTICMIENDGRKTVTTVMDKISLSYN